MHVIWNDDGHSIYGNVPRHEFDGVTNDWSVGKAIHNRIKPKYVHRYA
jgi:hypothetical protein